MKRSLKSSNDLGGYPERYISILGFLGLVGTIINFMLRQSSYIGGRYFYWLYLLMLLLSTLVVVKVSKKLSGLILCIALISMVSFYGVQDITLSGNTYVNGIGWADRKSWETSWTISSLLPLKVSLISDPRVESPLRSILSLKNNLEITYPRRGQVPQLLILGKDNIGYKTLIGAESWYGISSLIEREKGIVMSFGSYEVYCYER
jgi:hypothetical protein